MESSLDFLIGDPGGGDDKVIYPVGYFSDVEDREDKDQRVGMMSFLMGDWDSP